jgi:hypothetical protein
MSSLSLNAFRVYIVLLGVWTGSGVHDTFATHFAWYADPVAWQARPPWPGLVNPWPFSTMLLLLATLAAGIAVWRYKGPERRAGLISVFGCAIILVATLTWFVPQLGLMSAGTLTEPELVEHGRTWIVLNALRLVVLIVLMWLALISLEQFSAARRERQE